MHAHVIFCLYLFLLVLYELFVFCAQQQNNRGSDKVIRATHNAVMTLKHMLAGTVCFDPFNWLIPISTLSISISLLFFKPYRTNYFFLTLLSNVLEPTVHIRTYFNSIRDAHAGHENIAVFRRFPITFPARKATLADTVYQTYLSVC